MARASSRYICQSCGESFLRWEGQCRNCNGWNTLVETVVRSGARNDRAAAARTASIGGIAVPLSDVGASPADRLPVGIAEFDREIVQRVRRPSAGLWHCIDTYLTNFTGYVGRAPITTGHELMAILTSKP